MNRMNLKMKPLKIKDLPEDVVRHIMSYGYKEHKEYMKEICVKLDRSTILNKNFEIIENEFQNTHSDFTQLLMDVDKNILVKLFKQCTRCNCCTRHCHKRPKYLKGTISKDILTYTENYNDGCICKCRQLSRFICEAYPYSCKGNYSNINYEFVEES